MVMTLKELEVGNSAQIVEIAGEKVCDSIFWTWE